MGCDQRKRKYQKMKTIKGKKAQTLKQAYLNATADSVLDLYKKPSIYKLEAENNIWRDYFGHGIVNSLRFWGANTYYFSAGYRFYDYNGKEMLVIYTGRNVYYIEM